MKKIICIFLVVVTAVSVLSASGVSAAVVPNNITGALKPEDYITFITDEDWESLYVYSWNTAFEINADWPGKKFEGEPEINENGEKVYHIVLPDYTEGLVLNDGADNKTGIINYTLYDTVYTNGNRNPDGSLKVNYHFIGYHSDDYVYIYNTLGWEKVYFQVWSSDCELSRWPGYSYVKPYDVLSNGVEIYKLFLPDGALGMVVSNGNDCSTVPIYKFGGRQYMISENTNENGQYDLIEDMSAGGRMYFNFINSQKWENVYVYAWNSGGDVYGEWPGMKLEHTVAGMCDDDVYDVDITAGAEGYIFNDGEGRQTSEINNPSLFGVYFPEQTADQNGHFAAKLIDSKDFVKCRECGNYAGVTINVIPTCYQKDGIEAQYCPYCGNLIVEEYIIPSLGHNFVTIKGFEPDETHEGLTDGVRCTRCGEWKVERAVIPKKGEEVKTGDSNGDGVIDINDATEIQKAAAELITLEGNRKAAADVNSDGSIDINDATLVQKYTAELIESFS